MFNALGQRDVAVDLGTTNTLIYVEGLGVLLSEPSMVARDRATKEPIAVGTEAKFMMGRTPANIEVIRPLVDGVITEFEACEQMLRYFIAKALPNRRMGKPRMVICVPSGITAVEHRSVRDAAEFAGARDSVIVEEPVAAAIGAGLPIHHAAGNLVIDIGGGTTEIAVISLNGVVYSETVRVGGDRFDESIVAYVRRTEGALIGEATAERIKQEIGAAYPQKDIREIDVRGRNLAEGVPRSFVLTSNEILEALQEPLAMIVAAVKSALEQTPPELASDIAETGMVLTGGGALLRDLDVLLAEETGLPVVIAEDPLTCVARGGGKALEMMDSAGNADMLSTE